MLPASPSALFKTNIKTQPHRIKVPRQPDGERVTVTTLRAYIPLTGDNRILTEVPLKI